MRTKRPKAPPPEPPAHLSAHSQTLWREIVPRRAKSPERLELLTVALEARDRMAQARLAIAEAGLVTTTKTTGTVHLHPLLRVEKESRTQFLQAWVALALEFDTWIDGSMDG